MESLKFIITFNIAYFIIAFLLTSLTLPWDYALGMATLFTVMTNILSYLLTRI